MNPTIKNFPTTKFIGKNLSFTYADYRAFELWSSFMPRRKDIQNAIGTELYNIQINPENFDFSPTTLFTKWAAVAVSSFDFIPEGMETKVMLRLFSEQFIPSGCQVQIMN